MDLTNAENIIYFYLATANFEEALHLTRANHIKNAYIPKYPVYSNVPSLIATRAVECNADFTCENRKKKR